MDRYRRALAAPLETVERGPSYTGVEDTCLFHARIFIGESRILFNTAEDFAINNLSKKELQ